MPSAHFDQDRAMALLLHGTEGIAGENFFKALVQNAAEAFETDAAWLTEYLPETQRLRAIAFWYMDHFIEDYEYPVANTPCGVVVDRAELVVFPDRIVELFPTDPDLAKLGAVSYMGAPMVDPEGVVIGHFSVMHSEPLVVDRRMSAIFELFALRASTELQRLRAVRRLQEVNLEADALRQAVHELPDPGGIVGDSRPVRHLKDGIARVAPTDATVLIMGETGTGKELVARAIHKASTRAEKPLIRVNCAAIPSNLIESEFFGHERGSFTGAIARREGRFSLADGGTIFLDEVGEIPVDLQPKLLRVLQEGEFESIGSAKTQRVDVRVIAATNRDLARRVHQGEFREDLYYRLCVFPLQTPPLRDRDDDIATLARRFVVQFAEKMRQPAPAIQPGDMQLLRSYSWPGNVRELQNVIERAMILAGSAHVLDLRNALPNGAGTPQSEKPRVEHEEPAPFLTYAEMKTLERQNIERALTAAGGKIAGATGAAALLGLPASTLASKMKVLGI